MPSCQCSQLFPQRLPFITRLRSIQTVLWQPRDIWFQWLLHTCLNNSYYKDALSWKPWNIYKSIRTADEAFEAQVSPGTSSMCLVFLKTLSSLCLSLFFFALTVKIYFAEKSERKWLEEMAGGKGGLTWRGKAQRTQRIHLEIRYSILQPVVWIMCQTQTLLGISPHCPK